MTLVPQLLDPDRVTVTIPENLFVRPSVLVPFATTTIPENLSVRPSVRYKILPSARRQVDYLKSSRGKRVRGACRRAQSSVGALASPLHGKHRLRAPFYRSPLTSPSQARNSRATTPALEEKEAEGWALRTPLRPSVRPIAYPKLSECYSGSAVVVGATG